MSSIIVSPNNQSFKEESGCLLDISGETLLAGTKKSIIPRSVTRINSCAFCGCCGLTDIEIPDSVKEIGKGVFARCPNMNNIKVSSNNQSFKEESGCLLDISGSILFAGTAKSNIPRSVTRINSCAFRGCKGLVKIEIPNSVTSIGDFAFCDCEGLISVDIPDSITVIEEGTFSGCKNLTNIRIPDSVTSIRDAAFLGCENLTSFIVSNCIEKIGRGVFHACTGLKELQLKEKDPSAMEECLRFTGLENPELITLYVPIGTGYAYRHNTFFAQFKEVIPKL